MDGVIDCAADFAVRAAPGGKTLGFVWSFGASLG